GLDQHGRRPEEVAAAEFFDTANPGATAGWREFAARMWLRGVAQMGRSPNNARPKSWLDNGSFADGYSAT
ncbi:MAG: hypothetical protein ACI91B_004064, partial [Planctomycetota bacterium]